MNKAFVSEINDGDDEEISPAMPSEQKNYLTRAGYQRMHAELLHLLDKERPEVVQVVSWAASNGDRSENGDYLYGKKRLREIDRRIRFLTKRLDLAEVVDISQQENTDQVFFGATVRYENSAGEVRTVRIVGVDEVDPLSGHISWISPVARALLKARVGDVVSVLTPNGLDELEIASIDYIED
ncbi:MAG: transcription elongation factor GreB [Burkholderiaceae bacterium]|nr:MAG: transcription elongation factor GreB [Burkholderiaceae bacterium]